MIVQLHTAKVILNVLRLIIFISLFFILLSALWSSARAQTFTAATNYPAGAQPVSIADR